MKGFKKLCSAMLSMVMIFTLCIPAYAAGWNIEGEPVDRGGKAVRVDIPNGDGTFTILEGDAAQEWYDRAVQEGNERAAREADLAPVEEEISLVIPFIIGIAMLSLVMFTMWKGWNLKKAAR